MTHEPLLSTFETKLSNECDTHSKLCSEMQVLVDGDWSTINCEMINNGTIFCSAMHLLTPQYYSLDSTCMVQALPSECDTKFEFNVFKPGNFHLHLRVTSELERTEWIKRLRAEIMTNRMDERQLNAKSTSSRSYDKSDDLHMSKETYVDTTVSTEEKDGLSAILSTPLNASVFNKGKFSDDKQCKEHSHDCNAKDDKELGKDNSTVSFDNSAKSWHSNKNCFDTKLDSQRHSSSDTNHSADLISASMDERNRAVPLSNNDSNSLICAINSEKTLSIDSESIATLAIEKDINESVISPSSGIPDNQWKSETKEDAKINGSISKARGVELKSVSRQSSSQISHCATQSSTSAEQSSKIKPSSSFENEYRVEVLRGTYTGERSEQGLRSGTGTYELNGHRYEGEWLLDAMHGQGKMTSADSTVYIGAWSYGVQHGNGFLTWPDGSTYQGDFVDGERHGKGMIKSPGDSPNFSYSGAFVNNLICGIGLMKWANGNAYRGSFEDGKAHGTGAMNYANSKCKYIGTFKNGKRHGDGKLFNDINEMTLEGMFCDDELTGSCTLRYKDGGNFCGTVVNWMRSGRGRMKFSNGDSYDGMWRDDQPSGQGIFTYEKEQSTYGGVLKNGMRHGPGKVRFQDGLEYDGMWNSDLPDGLGRLTYSNNNYFMGEWVAGRRTGSGRLSFMNGTKYEGDFIDGQPHGLGLYTHSSGIMYEGEFKRWLRCGAGTMTLIDGSIIEGVWLQDQLIEFEQMYSSQDDDDSNDEKASTSEELIHVQDASHLLNFHSMQNSTVRKAMCFTLNSVEEQEDFGLSLESTLLPCSGSDDE